MNKYALAIFFLLVGLLIGYFVFGTQGFTAPITFDGDFVTENNGFVMHSNLICKIQSSTDSTDIGEPFSVLNVETESPLVVFASGVESPMVVLHSADDYVSIQLATATGSTDTIVINKMTGAFTRVSSGYVFEVYAYASEGFCR